MNTHTTTARFAAAAAGIACFAIAGCGAEVAPAQDIGIVEPTQTAAEPRISADAAERAGQQDPGDAPGTHKPPPDFRP